LVTKPNELLVCVDVLCHKKWSRTLVDGQLKSRSWWERHRKSLIDTPAIKIEAVWEPNPMDIPIPYEEEFPAEKTGL